MRILQAGEFRGGGSSVFSHLLCSMSCSRLSVAAAEPWPRVGPALPEPCRDSLVRCPCSQHVQRETGRGALKSKQTEQTRGWLHLCTKEDGRNLPALLDHWSTASRVQPQIPANTRCSKVWNKAQGSRQPCWQEVSLLILTCLIFFPASSLFLLLLSNSII